MASQKEAMQQISERDMTVRSLVRGSDEVASLGSYLHHTLDVLREFFGSVRAATGEADTLSDTLSASTAESLSAVNEISTSSEQL